MTNTINHKDNYLNDMLQENHKKLWKVINSVNSSDFLRPWCLWECFRKRKRESKTQKGMIILDENNRSQTMNCIKGLGRLQCFR